MTSLRWTLEIILTPQLNKLRLKRKIYLDNAKNSILLLFEVIISFLNISKVRIVYTIACYPHSSLRKEQFWGLR